MERTANATEFRREANGESVGTCAQLGNVLMTVKDVCAAVKLARSTVNAKVKEGTFPAPIKLSARCVRWHSKSIQQWIDGLADVQAR